MMSYDAHNIPMPSIAWPHDELLAALSRGLTERVDIVLTSPLAARRCRAILYRLRKRVNATSCMLTVSGSTVTIQPTNLPSLAILESNNER